MNLFNKIYRLAWLVLLILIVFFDRNNIYWVIITLFLIIILASIFILRSIESRNAWRKYIKDEKLDEDNI